MSPDAIFLSIALLAPVLLGGAAFGFLRAATRPGRRPGAAAILGGNALFLLFLVSALFLAFELYHRHLYDATDTANRSRLSRRWFERYWHVNADEIRDDVDYARARAAGRRRITFLGDSYTTGHGIAQVEDRFVNRIRRARPGWDVHALAYNGINSVEQVDLLRRFVGEGYELDVVVLVFVYNDIDSFIHEFQTFYRRIDIPPGFLAPLLETSYTADLFYRRWRQRQAALDSGIRYPVLRSEAYTGEPWESLQYTLGLLEADVRGHGGRLAAVTFPWMQMLDAGEVDLPMYARMEEHWKARGVPHLQLLPVMQEHVSEGLLVNRRDTHPNERAHEIASDAILDFLESDVLPPPSDRVR
jgi:hypothetical protein